MIIKSSLCDSFQAAFTHSTLCHCPLLQEVILLTTDNVATNHRSFVNILAFHLSRPHYIFNGLEGIPNFKKKLLWQMTTVCVMSVSV